MLFTLEMSHSVLVKPGGKKETRDQSRASSSEGAADQSNLLGLKDVTQGQSSCLTCLVSQDIYRKKKKIQKSTRESASRLIQWTTSYTIPLAL